MGYKASATGLAVALGVVYVAVLHSWADAAVLAPQGALTSKLEEALLEGMHDDCGGSAYQQST